LQTIWETKTTTAQQIIYGRLPAFHIGIFPEVKWFIQKGIEMGEKSQQRMYPETVFTR
jgi:hypothetical protein